MDNKLDEIKKCVETKFKFNEPIVIFIYTPPKVGSTTLVTSLRVSFGKNAKVIHIHDDISLSIITGINGLTVNYFMNYLSQIGKIVYVIDVYRSPIERKISDFFEKISYYHFNNSEENISKYEIHKINDRFNKLFPYLASDEYYFNKYNISDPIVFDFEKKYTIQVMNNIKFIKLRLCDSDIWNTILTQIFNREIVIINDYQTENKQIGELYKTFKQQYRLPCNYFELVKTCKYLQFYYSETQKNEYLDYWNKKLTDECIPYTENEYYFYSNLSSENQYMCSRQKNHYIDNGCYCPLCSIVRYQSLIKVKNNENVTEKITHEQIIKKYYTKINNQRNKPQKFKKNQFKINIT